MSWIGNWFLGEITAVYIRPTETKWKVLVTTKLYQQTAYYRTEKGARKAALRFYLDDSQFQWWPNG